MSKVRQKFPQKGEIWVIYYNYKPKKGKVKDLQITSSIKKFRPSLILSNNIQNEFDEEIIAAPLSTQELDQIEPYQVFVKVSRQNGLKEDSKILLHRLRSVEKEDRLGDYCGVVSSEIMLKVKHSLKLVLDWEE